MQWFIKEQIEEVAKMSTLLRVVERAGDDALRVEEFLAREGDGGDGGAEPGMPTRGRRRALTRPFRFCPWCGAAARRRPTGVRQDCAGCGEPSYLNPKPTAGAIVRRRDGARAARPPRRRAVPRPLGRARAASSSRASRSRTCVRRELREEAGVECAVGRLVAAVPDIYGDGRRRDDQRRSSSAASSRASRSADDDVAELRWFAPRELPPPEELAFDVRARGARRLARASSRLRAARPARAGAR